MPHRSGTPEFLEQLLKRNFKPCSDRSVYRLVDGSNLLDVLHGSRFAKPIVVDKLDQLEMAVPPDTLSVSEAVRLAGGQREVDVINVVEQRDFRMQLADFATWWLSENRSRSGRLLNLLSLEISDSELGDMVQAPLAVRQLSLVNRCWPADQPTPEAPASNKENPVNADELQTSDQSEKDFDIEERPELLKFCLLSPAGSYTDFHIDFGGSSVWYHVLWGEKVFYLLPPNDGNLACYETWMLSSSSSTIFLGDRCARGPRVLRVTAGQTVLLPSGWVHAVYTPIDSMVFGGNFLHTYSLPMQIRIYKMELRLETEPRFQFPYFEKLHWLAAKLICDEFEAKKNNCGDSCSTASAYGSSKDDKDDDSKLAFKERRSLCRYLWAILSDWYANRSRAEPSIQRYFLPTVTSIGGNNEAAAHTDADSPARLLDRLKLLGSWAKHPTLPLVQKQRKQLKTSKRPASLSGSRGRSSAAKKPRLGPRQTRVLMPPPDLSAVEFQRMMSAFVQLQRLSGDQQADKASQLAAHLKFEAGPDSELVGSDGAGGACETTVVGEASAAGALRTVSPRRSKAEAFMKLRDKAPRMAAEPISPKAVLTRKVRLLPMSEQQPQKQSFTRSLCMECGDRFTCVELLMMHHLQQHSRRVPSSACICPHCYLVLPTPDRILKHIAALHLRFTDSVGNSPIANGANRLADKGADSGAEYFCGICRKFFRHKTSLTRHNRNFHSGA
ncbi:hypothetical protein BOX15_Mlig028134g3 [Macrostomum lignano]|uniref:JmjC domain-containing protein n=1 Tax=Macrostomum lignano TaxID=282301 RepID=A0A267F304_9PLAT|nr:hypothetical protein BOX15_Mlig028134g1 [Macrostomum lignano]PAA79141.1 hypothetical protein BOX15_Mlig028134g3 [Macrostomum lignano]